MFKRRKKKLKMDFKDGSKRAKMHNGHYRPYHYKLQKEYGSYDSDYVSHFYEDEDNDLIIKEAGTHKNSYKAHDSDNYDEYKDGN